MNKVLLGSAVTLLLLSGCNEDKKTTATQTTTTETATQQVSTTSQANAEAQKVTTQNIVKAPETVKVAPKEEKKVEEPVAPKVEEKKEVVQNPQQSTLNQETTTTEQQKTTSQTEEVAQGPSGEEIFKSCAACHGQKAEKEALGKSQVIKGWEKQKIIDAINGYKAGTYGGIMKNIMKGQVANKTDIEIDAVATFISNL